MAAQDRTASLPHTARDLPQPRTLEKAELGGSLDGKSLVLLRLPARKLKAYLLKTEDFSCSLSSVLHPPLPYQHFTALFSHTTIPSGSFLPSIFISPSERAHQVGICQQGIRDIIHSSSLDAAFSPRRRLWEHTALRESGIQSDCRPTLTLSRRVGTVGLSKNQHPKWV